MPDSRQDSSNAPRPAPLLAVSATFTAELVAAPLQFWIQELGWDYQIKFAPYNQVFQQLLHTASSLNRLYGFSRALSAQHGQSFVDPPD